jgi:hypothetical protein
VSPYRAKRSGPRLVEFKCGVCKGQKATEHDEVSYDEHAGASELYVVGSAETCRDEARQAVPQRQQCAHVRGGKC